jgi:mannose-1-phosphate guanylyltransferase
MINLILCGGSGTRLWPLSRQALPKQFCPLIGGRSLFEMTVERNAALASSGIRIAGGEAYLPLAEASLRQFGAGPVRGILEGMGRNTAPAIALVCLDQAPEQLVLVTPSDQLICNQSAYAAAVARAMELARTGKLVTFGITPTRPDTGYGWIEADGEKVIAFREKPDAATAETWWRGGRHLWNAGMFCFQAGVFLDELQRHSPDIAVACRQVWEKTSAGDGLRRIPAAEMAGIPSRSIDYAVMEKSAAVAVVPCDLGWSDLGSFDALYEVLDQDAAGNVAQGEESPLAIASRNNLVINRTRQTIVLIDVDDLVVVDTGDALLVMKRGSGQKIREAVQQLQTRRPDLLA